jgi:glycosyltransferase involved in cell wall biosynthesis
MSAGEAGNAADRPLVAFVVNGESSSAMGIRARSFASELGNQYGVRIAYRGQGKVRAIGHFLQFLRRARPRVTYVFDMSFSGVIAAGVYRLLWRNRLIIDTGDAIYELARSMGRGRMGLMLTWLLERFALAVADHIVVRGSNHAKLLQRRGIAVTFIPDGVDVAQFAAADGRDIRRRLGAESAQMIGVVGSCVWNERLQMTYGWDLVEALALMEDPSVRGIFVGDGTGIVHLKESARARGFEDRVHFAGRVAYDELPEWIAAMDICLSTQTNDLPGQVRTTGKLPLYLAAGKFILASRVGEAGKILPEEMLLDYEGAKDADYPQKLAGRITQVMRDPTAFSRARQSNQSLAAQFDYAYLSQRVHELLQLQIETAAAARSGRSRAPDAND